MITWHTSVGSTCLARRGCNQRRICAWLLVTSFPDRLPRAVGGSLPAHFDRHQPLTSDCSISSRGVAETWQGGCRCGFSVAMRRGQHAVPRHHGVASQSRRGYRYDRTVRGISPDCSADSVTALPRRDTIRLSCHHFDTSPRLPSHLCDAPDASLCRGNANRALPHQDATHKRGMTTWYSQ